MKTFIVELKIQAGEYEKSCRKLVKADSDAEAEKQALLSECHGEIDKSSEWTDTGIADLGWEFHYSVRYCKEIKEEHVEILQHYFSAF